MKYKEYKTQDFVKVADEVLSFWEENKVFERSVTEKEGKPTFTFYEGPPSANGAPGIHHVMARTVKDIFCRFKTLQGYKVARKGGWDTHGLPVELQVEKELGIVKDDIGTKISVEEYNQKCREAVLKYKDMWDDLTKKMGYWVDLEDPYITFETDYVESLWNLLKRLYDKDLLYKGYSVQPYSPAAGTGLSSHELNMPGCYRDIKDTTITAQFKVKKDDNSATFLEGTDSDVYILAWTTTPWTLPSNCALAIGKGINYAVVRTFNTYTHEPITVVLAKDVMGNYFNAKAKDLKISDYKAGDKLIPFEVVKEIKGSELVGIKYEQLLPYVQPDGKAFEVIVGDFVTTEDGTGVVHTASVFGADDYRVCQQAGIASILVKDEEGNESPLVDKKGKFVKEVTDFAGKFVRAEYEDAETLDDPNYKSTDVLIAIKLKEENKAFNVAKYEHPYPHCWRTDKPILYYPLDSWFIRTTAYKERMMELNNTINWKPESTGIGRFGDWLKNLVDWNLSRSRFWGTPLPIWRTEDGKEEVCIGSLAEMNAEIKKAVDAGVMQDSDATVQKFLKGEDVDLHRPFVDDITLVSASGKPMKREADLIDVWFDSGAMPFAQWHYPMENKDIFDANYPADYIAEGVDQTRGWFFTLHAISVMLEDSVAFKNVIANGLVLDKVGKKMSKRLGNATDPFETLKTYGADVTRWYMIENAPPWDALKFNVEGIKEVQRRFFGTLYNTYNFFALYANLDNFDYQHDEIALSERTEADRWIISGLNTLILEVEEAYEDYDATRAARAIQEFTVNDLSNWYVRLNRKRFWKGEYNEDKKAAYQTLYTCLKVIAKLMSPISPFYADRLFNDLNAVSGKDDSESVHLSDFPKADKSVIDTDLEERMHLAQNISSLVHSLRKKDRLKVRQPLSKILIPDLNEKLTKQIKAVEDIILSEVNIKSIEYLDDSSGILVKKIKPNFRELGKTYGKMMKDITAAINKFGQEDINKIEKENSYIISVQGQEINLTLDLVEIISEDIPGWSVAKDNGLTVALDITVTEELKQEGIARDIVNRVQNIRKDMGLDIQDKINIQVQKTDDMVNQAVTVHLDYICTETQALSLSLNDSVADATLLDLDGLEIPVSVSK